MSLTSLVIAPLIACLAMLAQQGSAQGDVSGGGQCTPSYGISSGCSCRGECPNGVCVCHAGYCGEYCEYECGGGQGGGFPYIALVLPLPFGDNGGELAEVMEAMARANATRQDVMKQDICAAPTRLFTASFLINEEKCPQEMTDLDPTDGSLLNETRSRLFPDEGLLQNAQLRVSFVIAQSIEGQANVYGGYALPIGEESALPDVLAAKARAERENEGWKRNDANRYLTISVPIKEGQMEQWYEEREGNGRSVLSNFTAIANMVNKRRHQMFKDGGSLMVTSMQLSVVLLCELDAPFVGAAFLSS